MSSRSSGTPVRRHLSFNSLPYRGQCFYLDIKTASVKNKLAQQIIELGGAVEGFLSKDLSLIVTDRGQEKHDNDPIDTKKPQKTQIPLSRGQALLKASQHQGSKDGHNQDFLQNASNLGVRTQKAAKFMQTTAKILSNVRSKQKTGEEKDIFEGMAKISWDKDKENMCIVKVEDNENLYRPLFKQFEAFPQMDYSQLGSPFDVGVVLTKEKENNQVKKKSVGGVLRGGYCESCDHWYKCTLREHLKSDKHISFVKSVANFRSLDGLTASLPNLTSFMGKYSLPCGNGLDKHKQSNVKIDDNVEICKKVKAIGVREDIYTVGNGKSETNYGLNTCSNFDYCSPDDVAPTVAAISDLTAHVSEKNDPNTKSNKAVFDSASNKTLTSDGASDRISCKTSRSVCSERKMTLNEVLQNVFDADNAVDCDFSNPEDELNTEQYFQLNSTTGHEMNFRNVGENLCADVTATECAGNMNLEKTNSTQFVKSPDQNKSHRFCNSSTTDINSSLNNLLHDSNSLRHGPEASFSSSCSFGDNGVGTIISLLQSNDSNSTHSSVFDHSHSTDKDVNIRLKAASESSECKSVRVSSHMSSVHPSLTHKVLSSAAASPDCASSQNSHVSKFFTQFKQKGTCISSENEADRVISQAKEVTSVSNKESCYDSVTSSATVQYAESVQSSTINYSRVNGCLNSETTVQSKHTVNDVASDYSASYFQMNACVQGDQVVHEAESASVSVAMCEPSVSAASDYDKTPTGKGSHVRQPCLEDLCRSGSSIRNWLLPKDDDDSMSVKTAVSKLDHTLMEMENSPAPIDAITDNNDITEVDNDTKVLPERGENSACNLVANWIQEQEFHQKTGTEVPVDSGKIDNHDQISFKDSADVVESTDNLGSADVVESSDNLDAVVYSALTDSCSYTTSISDCTVYNEDNNVHGRAFENIIDSDDRTMANDSDLGLLANLDSDKFEHWENTNDNVNTRNSFESHLEEKSVMINGEFTINNTVSKDSLSEERRSIANCSGNVTNKSDVIKAEIKVSIPDTNDCTNILVSHGSEETAHDKVNAPIIQEMKQVVSDNMNSSKGKGRKKAKQTKTSQAKKKPSKATKKSSVKETVTTHQMNNQPCLQPQTPFQNSFIGHAMYSPISMPSESLPNDPLSPFVNHMWQQQGRHMYQPQTYSPSHHHNDFMDNRQVQLQRPCVDYANAGLIPSSNSHSKPQAQNFQSYDYHHQQQQQNFLQHNSPCNPQVLVNQPCHSNMMDLLSNPAATGYNGFHQSPVTGCHQNMHHLTNQALLINSPNVNAFPDISNVMNYQSHSQHSSFQLHGNHLATVSDQTLPSPGALHSKGNLATICLADIAEDSTFNSVYTDSSRYVAKPRKRGIHNVEDTEGNTSNCHEQGNSQEQESIQLQESVGAKSSLSQAATVSNVSCRQAPPMSLPNIIPNQASQGYTNTTMTCSVWPQPPDTVNYNNVQTATGDIYQTDNCVYNAVQTGEMKLCIRKMPAQVEAEQKSNLTHYWNVRKAGECRLVFSSNVFGKRKAEEETPGKLQIMSHSQCSTRQEDDNQPQSKRRRCLVF